MALRLRRHGPLDLVAGTWRGWRVAILAAVFSVLLPLTTFIVAAWLLGWQLQSVQSGSMAPTYAVGSLLVVGAIDPGQVSLGTPIVFEDPKKPGHLVVHRVVAISPGNALAFRTQGDANAAPDPFPVPARLIRGRVLWHVNQLGAVTDWLQWPRSFLLLVVGPGLLLLAGEWRSRRQRGSPGQAAA